MNLKLVLTLFLLIAQNPSFSQSKRSTEKEQTDFSTEGEVFHNVPLPSTIRRLLEQDPFVRETLETESPPLKALPQDWTECSVVHLADGNEHDYVVIGQRFLTGAHATHFWVYRETPEGVKLVLFAFADSLSIQRERTNGLRNINALYYTAVSDGTIHYSFDGTKYRADHAPQYR